MTEERLNPEERIIPLQVGPEGTTLRITPESFDAHEAVLEGSSKQPHVVVDVPGREDRQLRVLNDNLPAVLENLSKREE